MTSLVRILSTGRAGTKYIANAFADQGYLSYHEDLYAGEPSSALIHYTRMLGDMWFHDRKKYYAYDSDFARPYMAAVGKQMGIELNKRGEVKVGKSASRKGGTKDSVSVVIDSGHRLTPATPLIEKEGDRAGVEIKYLILYRNPLRTIHGLFKVEGQAGMQEGPYRNRPASFSEEGGYLGAAGVWANTYRMAYDQRKHLGEERFAFLDLERFNFDEEHIDEIFSFLELDYDKKGFAKFANNILGQPLRSSKSDSARNSHVFHDPGFSFSEDEIEKIHARVEDVLEPYGMSWQKIVDDYVDFHAKEKERLGFDKG
jgi:hypothetical protein